MVKLTEESLEFIEALTSNEVEYLVVGGHAVAFHGYPRFTGDIDFWVRCTPENAERLARVFQQFGFTDSAPLIEIFSTPGKMLQLGVPPNRIDVLGSVSGLTFEEAWADRVNGEIGGVSALIVSARSLIKNKLASGRPKDLADASEVAKFLPSSPHLGER